MDIVGVVSDYIELKPKGRNYWGLCPFHDDKHLGSFIVNPLRNCYKCFSCGEGGGPIDFLMRNPDSRLSYPDAMRYLAQKYGIPLPSDTPRIFEKAKPAKPRDMATTDDNNLPKRLWPLVWTEAYRDTYDDNFVKWLRGQPWDGCQRKRMEEVLNDYKVSHVRFITKGVTHDWTVWWMMDEQGQLHNGHMMKFYPEGHEKFGHRDKTDPYPQTWLHACMKYVKGPNHFDEDKEAASYCLFGQHLLNRYPNATVNIVESEKTAVVMATAYGNHEMQIWMACAGMQNITNRHDILRPLINHGRRIVLYPDRDGIEKWKNMAASIGYDRIGIVTTPVTEWWKPDDGPKADVADVVVRMINERNNRPQTMSDAIQEWQKANPVFTQLHEQYKLQTDEKQYPEDSTCGG